MLYTYRSRLNQLPSDLKYELGEIPLQKGMLAPSKKAKAVELLTKYKIDFTEVGTGTNRFIFKYDGYAVKFALDSDGIADNKQEFAVCKTLGSRAATSYEISKGGHLLVAEYCPAFTSYQEMFNHNVEIEAALAEWSKSCVLGDVGISRLNYANWGLRGNQAVCIDYAYIFPATMHVFTCNCGSSEIVPTDSTYQTYTCASCKTIISDAKLRQRVTPMMRINMLANAFKNTIELTTPTKEIEIPDIAIPRVHTPDDPEFM